MLLTSDSCREALAGGTVRNKSRAVRASIVDHSAVVGDASHKCPPPLLMPIPPPCFVIKASFKSTEAKLTLEEVPPTGTVPSSCDRMLEEVGLERSPPAQGDDRNEPT